MTLRTSGVCFLEVRGLRRERSDMTHKPVSEDVLRLLAKFCKNRSRGPWSAGSLAPDVFADSTYGYTISGPRGRIGAADTSSDAEFMAVACWAMPTLLREVRRLRGVLRRVVVAGKERKSLGLLVTTARRALAEEAGTGHGR